MATPFGFRPARHLDGNNTFQSNPYQVDDSNPKKLYAGHLVALSSGKVVEATTTQTTPILGVIKAVYSATKNRPKTHSLPDGGNFVDVSSAAWVDVYDDPDIIFEGVADSAMNLSDTGQIGDIVASGSGRDSTGQSLMQLDASSFVAQTSANIGTLPLRCIGLSKKELTGTFSDGQIMEFVIDNHVFRQKTTIGS